MAVSCYPQLLGSLLVCGSVCVPGGLAEFSARTPVHMAVSSFFHASRVLPGTCSRTSVRGQHSRALPRGLVHCDQGRLAAYIGWPMPPWVFRCPPARGSVVLAVTFAFPGGSANCWHTRQTMHLYRRSWVLAGFFLFVCVALSPGHLSGVCGPLPWLFFFQAVAPGQAWSLGW